MQLKIPWQVHRPVHVSIITPSNDRILLYSSETLNPLFSINDNTQLDFWVLTDSSAESFRPPPSEKHTSNSPLSVFIHVNVCVSVCLMVFLLVASSLHRRKVWWTLWIHERTHLSAYSGYVCLSWLDLTVLGSYILATHTCRFSCPSVSSVRCRSCLWHRTSSSTWRSRAAAWGHGFRHSNKRCLSSCFRTDLKLREVVLTAWNVPVSVRFL